MSDPRRAFVVLMHRKRVELRLSQQDVGRRVGVHGNTVGKWESGKRWPTVERARMWARTLGVRVVGGDLEELFKPARGPAPAGPSVCGTPQGYRRHKQAGERCPACWAAWAEYGRGRYQERRAGSVQ